jgi:hypothetical protein
LWYLVQAQLKDDVNIILVFKEGMESDDIRMLQRAMNFDLSGKLLGITKKVSKSEPSPWHGA